MAMTMVRVARRRGRLRGGVARRLEILENRTLLNASIDIDADGLLTYATDGAIAETLNISVTGGVYTFASTVNIDVQRNVPGLAVTGDGATTVTVAAISGLAVDAGFKSDRINVLSADVDLAIHLNAINAWAYLGDRANPAGLGALTAPVTIIGPGVSTRGNVVLDNIGSAAGASYVVAPTTVTANNGFGGLTYSELEALSLFGSTGANEVVVQGTADDGRTLLDFGPGGGPNTFVVEGTSANPGSNLVFMGGPGANAYNIQALSSPALILAGAGSNAVNLGNSQGVAGINGRVEISSTRGGSVDIAIDNPAGGQSEVWELTGGGGYGGKLIGFRPGGGIQYNPAQINSLRLGGGGGLVGQLKVDFSGGNPLPAANGGGRLLFKGAAGPDGGLFLGGGSFISETHDAFSPSGGRITLGAGGREFLIDYDFDGASSWNIRDLISTPYYTFNNRTVLESPFIIARGAEAAGGPDGNFQTLLLSPTGNLGDGGLNIGLKRDVTVSAGPFAPGGSVTVNYLGETSVRSLETLKIVTNGGGTVDFANLPPRIYSALRQGDGDDQAAVSVAGLGQASRVILDGGPGDNALVLDAGGAPLTPSRFLARPGGPTEVNLSPGSGPLVYSNYQHVLVSNASLSPLVVTAERIFAVRGRRLVDVVAGRFVTDAPGAEAGDFTATIDWGDGSSSPAVIVPAFWNPSLFYVTGTHVYQENAESLTTTITVNASPSAYTHTRTINGASVTFELTGAGGSVSADGTAAVATALVELTVESFEGVANVAPSPPTAVVATFTDLGVNPAAPDPTARYLVTVDWGDGSGAAAVPDGGVVYDGATKVFTVTTSQHIYTAPGNYVVTVTVNERPPDGFPGAVLATGTGVAHIVDSALSAVAPQPAIPDVAAGAPLVDQIVGSFLDANPLARPGEFTAMIDWGDGSAPSPGKVTQPGGAGSPLLVAGSHVYADARPAATDATYPIRIHVQSALGATVELSNTITVVGRPVAVSVSGRLNPASDSGVSNTDAITNVVRPNFLGAASEPGALVFLYATPPGGSTTLIGRAAADPAGAWSITPDAPLADGAYAIQVQARDASGHSTSELTTITPNLVIDTVGPRVTDARVDYRSGRALVDFQDFGGAADAGAGLVQSTLADAGNYRFSPPRPVLRGMRGGPRRPVRVVGVEPGTSAGPQLVTIQINGGRPVRPGPHRIDVAPASSENPLGVRDVAGNPLEGRLQWPLAPANRFPPPRRPAGPVAPWFGMRIGGFTD